MALIDDSKCLVVELDKGRAKCLWLDFLKCKQVIEMILNPKI